MQQNNSIYQSFVCKSQADDDKAEKGEDALDILSEKDIRCIHDNTHDTRLKKVSKLPKTREEVRNILFHLKVKTCKGKQFVHFNDHKL